jgi:hypothetical protein
VLAFSGIVCVALCSSGDKGKKSTPSVGWEVLMRSHRLASGSWMEHVPGQRIQRFLIWLRYTCVYLY